jgi:RNA polymerase sigma-70 factor (ECF subfamily)
MNPTVFTDEPIACVVEEDKLDSAARMEVFLRDVQARAYRITCMTVRDKDEALDIVQDSMIRLARRYAARPSEEWPPLFYRILQNRTKDWHRRQAVKRRLFSLFSAHEESGQDLIATAPAPECENPVAQLERDNAMVALEQALAELPARQRQAFVLRNFEGLDVKGTAIAMGCSDGSVKTHYSRALSRLRALMGEYRQ